LEFSLSPHVKAILCGRGMCKDNRRLLCSAPNCLYHPKDSTDPNFGRDIRIKGYVVCPRCGAKTDYEEKEWSDTAQSPKIKCVVCNKIMSLKRVIWTQKVISKHRRNSHEYYHKECWDNLFIDIPDEEESAHYYGYYKDNLIVRLIKWASKI